MPAKSKTMGVNRIRPKKMQSNPIGMLHKTALNLGSIAKKTHQSMFKKLNDKQILCYELSNTVKNILSKLAKMDVESLKTIFLDSHGGQVHNTNYEQFVEKCRNNFEIESRFEECYQYSIIHDYLKLESFVTNSNMTMRQLEYLSRIISDLHKKLSLDEVDQLFDVEEKNFFVYLTVQFNDPRGGVMRVDRDLAYDFFKEWISSVWKEVDPDTPIRASSRLSKKSKRKNTKKKRKKSKKSKNKKKTKAKKRKKSTGKRKK